MSTIPLTSDADLAPAYRLSGQILDGGWEVEDRIIRPEGATGSHFSVCYHAKNTDGRLAFLKALDFSIAFNSSDVARTMQYLTEAFNYERNLLTQCRTRHFTRVVTAIADGQVRLRDNVFLPPTPYLIFEKADTDIRGFTNFTNKFEAAWALRSMHHITNGLAELHSAGIAHQDLKPSNVLVFSDERKIADLGRASQKGQHALHDDNLIAGDRTYAPPEAWYGVISDEWGGRRLGCDLYHLGSLLIYFFMGQSMTSLIAAYLDASFYPENWSGTFLAVTPFLRDTFDQVFSDFQENVPAEVREDIVTVARQLCEPNPALRGHPLTRAQSGNPYSLERYLSIFDRSARNLELKMRRPPD